MPILAKELSEYCYQHTSPENALLEKLAKDTREKQESAGMMTGRIEGRFLGFIAGLLPAKRALEIGMFTGYSALSIAEGMPQDGRLITCEKNPEYAEFAKKYIEKSAHKDKIEIRVGSALETIATLSGPFDLVFIDADKVNYSNYYEKTLPLVRPGGFILIDNSLWGGSVLNPEQDSALAIAKLNDDIAKDDRVENVLLSIRDGVNMVRKK